IYGMSLVNTSNSVDTIIEIYIDNQDTKVLDNLVYSKTIPKESVDQSDAAVGTFDFNLSSKIAVLKGQFLKVIIKAASEVSQRYRFAYHRYTSSETIPFSPMTGIWY